MELRQACRLEPQLVQCRAMDMTTRGLLFFNLETWNDFQGMHLGRSKQVAESLWASISTKSEVRRLYDLMGRVHLGVSIEVLQHYASKESVAALLQDWWPSKACQDQHVQLGANVDLLNTAGCPTTPTLSEHSGFRSPSPPSFRNTPSPQPKVCSPTLDQRPPSPQGSVCTGGVPIVGNPELEDDWQKARKASTAHEVLVTSRAE